MGMKKFWLSSFLLGAVFGASGFGALAQTGTAPAGNTSENGAPAKAALATDPWELGAFFQGGLGTGDRDDFTFLSAGARLGKVITDQHLPGILRGQFEYAGELMPYWQSFTPAPHTAETEYIFEGHT
ncbi:MAG: hypothetical protein WA826_22825, partial [Silvibacterium sp.]